MKKYLSRHSAAHPSMQPQDVIKLCYQSVFGAEHLLTDPTKAQQYFAYEWDNVPPSHVRLWEPISEEYGRIDLGAWKDAGLPREWLFRMFLRTASESSGKTVDDLQNAFGIVRQMAGKHELPFSLADWEHALALYEQQGGGAVHHSEAYRQAEHPAYRVVHRRFLSLIPLLQQLTALSPHQDSAAVIAIDGRAASGKTTLTQSLAEILEAGVVHMDDFFLPPALRTPERLREAGGNVHYERFAEQVIPRLKNNESFTYQTFSCSKMCLDGERTVKASAWRIVEGSYSHHPKLGRYMHFRVFCHVSPQEQMRRIIARNGESMAQMFSKRWIPMEEAYFAAYSIREQADFQVETEDHNQGE